MSNVEEKINIIAKGDETTVKVLKGNDFYTLKDLSCYTFATSSITSFIDYIKSIPGGINTNIFLKSFARTIKAEAWLEKALNSYHGKPIAKIAAECTGVFGHLLNVINSKITLKNAYDALKPLTKYGDNNLINLIVFTRECGFSAITKFDNTRDDRGNFNLSVSRNQQGEFKQKFPETCKFTVPMFNHLLGEDITIETSNVVDYDQTEKAISVTIQLNCIDILDIIEQRVNAIIHDYFMKPLKNKIFVGEVDHCPMTNERFIKENVSH